MTPSSARSAELSRSRPNRRRRRSRTRPGGPIGFHRRHEPRPGRRSSGRSSRRRHRARRPSVQERPRVIRTVQRDFGKRWIRCRYRPSPEHPLIPLRITDGWSTVRSRSRGGMQHSSCAARSAYGPDRQLHGLSLELRAELPASLWHEQILSAERPCPRSLVRHTRLQRLPFRALSPCDRKRTTRALSGGYLSETAETAAR